MRLRKPLSPQPKFQLEMCPSDQREPHVSDDFYSTCVCIGGVLTGFM